MGLTSPILPSLRAPRIAACEGLALGLLLELDARFVAREGALESTSAISRSNCAGDFFFVCIGLALRLPLHGMKWEFRALAPVRVLDYLTNFSAYSGLPRS